MNGRSRSAARGENAGADEAAQAGVHVALGRQDADLLALQEALVGDAEQLRACRPAALCHRLSRSIATQSS